MTIKSREEKLRLNVYNQSLIAHKGKDVYGVSGWMFTDSNEKSCSPIKLP